MLHPTALALHMTRNGVSLAPAHLKPLNLAGGRHGVMLFHGLSSSPLELQFVARGLHRAGYSVRVPVIEGYTYGLPGDRPASAMSWVAQALAELDKMLQAHDSVSIGGLCLGAVLALCLAARRNDRLSHVLALSTALNYDGWGNPWFTPLLPLARYVPFARRIRIRERSPFGLKDERMRAWVARQMKEAGESDAGASALRVGDLLKARDLIAMARRATPDISAPLLLIHAKDDECATPRSSFEVAQKASARSIRCVLLEDSYHMISIDREKERVLSEMLQFLSCSDEGGWSGEGVVGAKVVSLLNARKGMNT
jgi:carboxylesterase